MKTIPFLLVFLATSLFLSGDHPGYTQGRASRDGIGKFYMGREISQVMGHLGAGWLERPEREREERTDLLIDLLDLRIGDVVGDIGAGSGYFSWRFADRVAPTGKVYANDIQPEMLEILAAQMRQRGVADLVVPVLGTITDTNLPANSCDLIILIDVYHEMDHPYEMGQSMVNALKPEGRLVLVEYRLEDPRVPIKRLHKMSEAQVKKEMAVHDVTFVENIDKLPRQHVLVFQKNPASEP